MVQRSIIAALLAAAGLSACGDAAPKGQVVAIVNGEEVTEGELRTEAEARGLSSLADPAARSDLLRELVGRKLLAQEARREKLDRQVRFVLMRRRAEELLLADLLLGTVREATEPPTDGDVRRFLRDNPSAFAGRTVFRIDQITVRPEGDGLLAAKLAKARSLGEVDALLADLSKVGQRSRTEWSSDFMPAPLAAKLRRLPAGALFTHEDGGRIVVGTVLAKTDVPLGYRERETLARENLRRRAERAAVEGRFGRLRTSAEIEYQAGRAPR